MQIGGRSPVLLGATAAGVGLVLMGTPAAAQDGADDATLEVVAGVNGHHEPGDHLLVQVSVTADRLVEGRLVVTSGPGGLESTQAIQVAAGATERADLVVPTRIWDQSGLEVELVDDDGDVIAEERVTLRVDPSVELVGVLPGVATRVGELPEQVTLAAGTGRAELAPLAVDQLRLGPGVLEVFDTIVGVGRRPGPPQ